jgi:hypothetical protein
LVEYRQSAVAIKGIFRNDENFQKKFENFIKKGKNAQKSVRRKRL